MNLGWFRWLVFLVVNYILLRVWYKLVNTCIFLVWRGEFLIIIGKRGGGYRIIVF